MSALEGLSIVLHSEKCRLDDDQAQAEVGVATAQAAAASLDDLQGRLATLAQRVGIEPTTWQQPRPASAKAPTETHRHEELADWATIRSDAETHLRQRGVRPDDVSLNDLLDPAYVDTLEKLHRGGFRLETQLDPYDLAAIAAAGFIGALVDFFIVRIPQDMTYLGQFSQEGSPLTKWMHSIQVPHDNWLAQHCKASFDRVAGVPIEGFSPRTHRLQTFGHDPLLGLLIGTIDIMRGGLTGISRSGEVVILNNMGPRTYNPLEALVCEVLHLMSDGFTKMGLPAPGWTLLQALQIGSLGEKERTIAELARFMYLKGYDSRHFLPMASSVAAVEVVLRGYFWLRRRLDPDYERRMMHLAEVAGARRTDEHPHFQALALGAHTVATASNAGKIVIYGGNPLAINYAQWLRFMTAAFAWLRTRLASPSVVLKGHARANWMALEGGWVIDDATFPQFTTDVNNR